MCIHYNRDVVYGCDHVEDQWCDTDYCTIRPCPAPITGERQPTEYKPKEKCHDSTCDWVYEGSAASSGSDNAEH